MHYDYKTAGTCSKKISFDMDENGIVTNTYSFLFIYNWTFGVAFY